MADIQKKSIVKEALDFIPEVQAEIKKVTWPTRRETIITSVFVFIFALIAAIYFSIVDWGVYKGISYLLGLGQ